MFYVNRTLITSNTNEETLLECEEVVVVRQPPVTAQGDLPLCEPGVWLYGVKSRHPEENGPFCITQGMVYVMNEHGATVARYDATDLMEDAERIRHNHRQKAA